METNLVTIEEKIRIYELMLETSVSDGAKLRCSNKIDDLKSLLV